MALEKVAEKAEIIKNVNIFGRGDNDIVTNYFSSRKKLGLLSLFNYAKESLLPERNKKAF